jgi:UDP-N-acetylmuramyl pentapeptide phosphotransferase/UDP-N-acetylglucosamine-1-phosphate transferase
MAAAALCLLLSLALRPWVFRRLVAAGWTRGNYQGRCIPRGSGQVPLLACLPSLAFLARAAWPSRAEATVLLAALLFALLGLLDDRWGDRGVGGLKGHFRKLLRERILTTGAVKAVGGTLGALALAAWFQGPQAAPTGVAVGALLIALCANALNLVDTRPCRVLALFMAGEAALLVWQVAAGRMAWAPLCLVMGAAPLMPSERRRHSMLGDTGANLLGGALGAHAATQLPLWGQGALVLLLLWLHLYSERHSLNETIASTPWLSRLDRLVQG